MFLFQTVKSENLFEIPFIINEGKVHEELLEN